jgi:hypothetical protein
MVVVHVPFRFNQSPISATQLSEYSFITVTCENTAYYHTSMVFFCINKVIVYQDMIVWTFLSNIVEHRPMLDSGLAK